MSAEKPADIIPLTPTPDASAPSGVGRRSILQSFAAGVGAAFAIPGIAGAQEHPVQHHMAAGTTAAAQKKAAAAAYTPELLDAHQMKTLEVLAEAIVPGSTEAKVAPFLDTLVAVDSAENQRNFLGALGAFDMFAIDKYSKPWIALTPVEQDTLLQTASTTAPGNRPGIRGHRRRGVHRGQGHDRRSLQQPERLDRRRVFLLREGRARTGLGRQRVPHGAARLHAPGRACLMTIT